MYERAGGDAFFEQLTLRFYAAVRDDPVLAPLYPADDPGLETARLHLREFLVQYWGGPDRYRRLRGAPALRARHARFRIGPAERDAWLRHMLAAVRAGGLAPLDEAQMVGYLQAAAAALVTTADPPDPPGSSG
jgi:hemoglobin